MHVLPKALIAASVLGLVFSAGYLAHRPAPAASNLPVGAGKILYYHDPMHPAYKSDKPGIAPDCGMALEPVYAESGPEQLPPGAVRLTPGKEALIGLRTAPVSESSSSRSLRFAGKVAADESRIDQISALADGVVRKVSPVAPGSIVHQDELLATYFVASRDIYNAMQAFFLASGTLDQNATSLRNPGIISPTKANTRVEEELLKSYGVTSAQIKEMVRTHEITRDIDFRAPINGVVLERSVAPGSVVSKGAQLFRIADLSHVWVLADVFERDADSFRRGTNARVIYEGKSYRATVTDARQFDPNSHTFKVRLEMDNPGLALRPDMFVTVEAEVNAPKGISVPLDSIVDNGREKVVFVAVGEGVYQPRPVATGTEYNGHVQITGGLKPSDTVVVDGLFLLDSESRLQASASQGEGVRLQTVQHNHDKDAKGGEHATQGGVSDPVCGMPLSGKPEHSSLYQGTTYHFCSKDCKEKFENKPSSYAPKNEGQQG